MNLKTRILTILSLGLVTGLCAVTIHVSVTDQHQTESFRQEINRLRIENAHLKSTNNSVENIREQYKNTLSHNRYSGYGFSLHPPFGWLIICLPTVNEYAVILNDISSLAYWGLYSNISFSEHSFSGDIDNFIYNQYLLQFLNEHNYDSKNDLKKEDIIIINNLSVKKIKIEFNSFFSAMKGRIFYFFPIEDNKVFIAMYTYFKDDDYEPVVDLSIETMKFFDPNNLKPAYKHMSE